MRARPEDFALRRLLVRQLIEAGQFDNARKEVAKLEAQVPRADTMLLDLEIASREAYALPESDPRHAARLAALHARVEDYSREDWSQMELAQLAELASRVGANQAATRLHKRLFAEQAPLPAAWWVQAARRMLALGDPRQAGELFLHAQTLAELPSNRRTWLIEGLRALQAAGAVDQALALGEARSVGLHGDRELELLLTRLAQASGNAEASVRHARALLKMSRERGGKTVIASQFEPGAFLLAYDILVGAGELGDAQIVAATAVARAPADLGWRARLAQIADWSGQAPLALEQWRVIARRTGRDSDWAEVERRSPQVRDHAAWLEALLRRQAHHATPERTRSIIAAYELLGEPEAALAYLGTVQNPRERQWSLEMRAQLEAQLGLERQRIATLTTLIREFGNSAERALELAIALENQGQSPGAWKAIRSAREQGGENLDFWVAYAQLAQKMGEPAEAIHALQRQLALGEAEPEVFIELVNLLGPTRPAEAAGVAQAGWKRWKLTFLASQVLALNERARRPDLARRFLAGLDQSERRQLERDTGFLAARAGFHLSQGEFAAALADARAGLKLKSGSAELVGLLVWTGIAAQDAPLVRESLDRYATLATENPNLWSAWSSGWLALGEPGRARPWLQRQLAQDPSALTWLTYADALEQLGQADLAWRIRRHTWMRLGQDRELAASEEGQARLSALAPHFEPADPARARLAKLLSRPPSPVIREAALSAFLGTEQVALAQAWMLANYSRELARPAWAELSVALSQDDRPTIARLIDTIADWLPALDRVQAARRGGQIGLAQTLASEAAHQRPDHPDIHEALQTSLLERSPSSGAAFEHSRQWPLSTSELKAHTGLRLSPGRTFSIELRDRKHRSEDSMVLTQVPEQDREIEAGLSAALGDGQARVWLRHRNALAAQTGAGMAVEHPLPAGLQASLTGALHEASYENAYLAVGGARNRASAALAWQATTRESVRIQFDALRYVTQGGNDIGSGRVFRVEASSLWRLAYPEFATRLWWQDQQYASAGGPMDPLMASLMPPEFSSLGKRFLLPFDSRQFGITLAAGSSAAETYSRAWRPWAEFSAYRDSVSGMNTNWSAGVAGPVFGADRLSLGAEGGTATASSPFPYQRFGVSWRWYH